MTELAQLKTQLVSAARGLDKVTERRMFGCDALFANGNVFGLVWKHGRIGLRLPDEAAYGSLLRTGDASPWKAGPMTMAHWVLVPTVMHRGGADLTRWTQKAHGMAMAQPPKDVPGAKVASAGVKAKDAVGKATGGKKRAAKTRAGTKTGAKATKAAKSAVKKAGAKPTAKKNGAKKSVR